MKMTIKTPILFTLLLLSVAWLIPANLSAQTDQFIYSVSGNTFTWTEPASPTPSVFFTGASFSLPGTSSNPAGNGGQLIFYNMAFGGGFAALTQSNVSTDNFVTNPMSQLYTGPESNPTFLLGTFTGFDFQRGGSATLSITAVTPEPETYATLGGFLILLFLANYMRRRSLMNRTKV
jgi:hypothetical protein